MRNKSLPSIGLAAVSCLALVACGSGDNGVKCSFKNPIVVDESANQWPKFRRDSQNTGTISLGNAAYQAVASSSAPQREPVWVFPRVDETARGAFVASPSLNSLVDSDRRVYIGSTDGTMFALGALDGVPSDTTLGDGILFIVSPATITSTAMVGTLDDLDAVVVGTGDTRLVAIDADGIILRRVWPFLSDSFLRSSPAMTLNGLFLTASLGSGIFGVCPNGVGRYAIASGSTESSPAVGRDTDSRTDGSFFLGSSDRRLRAIRPDGVIRWTLAMSAPIVASPVVQLSSDGTETDAIYVTDLSGLVAKVDDSGSGVSGFTFVRGSIGRTESSPALAQHPTAGLRLYLGSDDGNVYAIDAQSGAVIWSYATGGVVRSSPAVVLNADVASDPIVIVGSFDGSMYYIRDLGTEPSLVGSFSVPEDVDSPNIPNSIESSPAIDIDGTVIFGADNGRVYAIR